MHIVKEQHFVKYKVLNAKGSTLMRLMRHENGGAREDRTPDLLRARQALSQLSYGPKEISHFSFPSGSRQFKNLRQLPTA